MRQKQIQEATKHMIGWYFLEQRAGEKVRNPIQGEYFSDEAIENPAHALVREVCQNSIDARRPDTEGPVSIRFHVSGEARAVDAAEAAYWFGDAWEHLRAPGCGLRDVPEKPPACPYVLVEDFGTTGLTGNVEQWQHDRAQDDNRFFAFLRAEGVSEKQGQQGGRWGVGKTVFPRSSRFNLLAGLTIRADDGRSFLIGQAVLKYHELNGKPYGPDGMFGTPNSDGLVLPIEEAHALERFTRTFGLERGAAQTGLSVVLPYCSDDINAREILTAAMREYFHAILTGRLVVQVSGTTLPDNGVELNASTYCDHLREYGGELEAELLPVIDLATWAQSIPDAQRVEFRCHPETKAPSWTPDLLPPDRSEELAQRFRRGERLAIRVPVVVRREGAESQASQLDVYIQRDLDERGSIPRFVRNGILVGRRYRQVRDHRIHALIVAEEGALATLLGDAEPPAHTRWDLKTENFQRKRYISGKSYLGFVEAAPRKICELLSAHAKQKDRFSLAEFFPRPPMEEEGRRRQSKPKRGVEPSEPPQPRRPSFTVDKITGGFVIRRGDPDMPLPQRIEVKAAYDVRRGSALKRYHSADFQFERRPIRSSLKGVREITRKDNLFIFEPRRDDFRVELTGFDVNRDLFVRARAVEVRHEQTV